MPDIRISRTIIALMVVAAALLGACSTAAVTGMKVHIQNQEYQEAIHLADSVIAQGDSLDPNVWFWRGQALSQINQWQDAAISFRKAWENGASPDLGISDYWFTFYNSAAALMNDGDKGAAVQMLQWGMDIAPERPDFNMMLGDMALNVDGDKEAALDNFEAASEKAEALVAEVQQMMDAASNASELDYYSQELNQAKNILIQSLYNSGSVLTMLGMAAGDDQMQDYLSSAMDDYQKALDVDPTNVDVLSSMADGYLLMNDFDSAMQTFDQAISNIELGVSEGWLDPDEADGLKANILVSKGIALIQMEKYEEALDALSQARDLEGDDYVVLTSMAHANFVTEQYDEALDLLDSALGIDGLDSEQLANAYYMEYACFNRLENDEDAASAMEMALQFQPDNAEYWRYLASTYSRLGRRNDAIAAMEKAESLGAEDPQ